MPPASLPLNQIAFSVIDLRRTERWFREGFGFAPAGGSRLMMSSPLAERIQGLPGAASTCWWLVGRNPWFQLEFFQFERPMARPLPLDFRPCDIGYTRIGLWVEDFDATLERLARLGTQPIAAPVGPRGGRRACVRSPDGVHVEIMEDDPLGGTAPAGRRDCPVAARSVTLSVPDLERSAAFFLSLGLETWPGTCRPRTARPRGACVTRESARRSCARATSCWRLPSTSIHPASPGRRAIASATRAFSTSLSVRAARTNTHASASALSRPARAPTAGPCTSPAPAWSTSTTLTASRSKSCG